MTEACAEAWRIIEAQEVGPELERSRHAIQEIQRRGLDRVRASGEGPGRAAPDPDAAPHAGSPQVDRSNPGRNP